jgi:biotin operon repressor
MSTQLTTIHPKSLDEIPQAFQDWWAKYHRHVQSSRIHFLRRRRSENLLVLRSSPDRDIRLRVQENELSCELAGRKFQLVLNDFDVSTKLHNGFVLCEIKLRHSLQGPLRQSLSVVENTKHPIFFSRAINGLAELEQQLPKQRIDEASAASTDYMVLFKALTEPSVATQLATKDPLATARLRGVSMQQSILKESGGVLSGAKVARILGISRQAVDKRRRQGQLIGLTQGKRGYAYPAWQFEGGRTLAHLEKVLDRLRSHDPWMQLAFFLNGNDRLDDKSPLELLRAGGAREVEHILDVAASYGEQGAA